MNTPEERISILELTLRDLRAWITSLLQNRHHRQIKDDRGYVVNSYAAIEAPDWQARQKLDDIDFALGSKEQSTDAPTP